MDNVSLAELAVVCGRVRDVVTSVMADHKRRLIRVLQQLISRLVPNSALVVAGPKPYPGAPNRRCHVCNDRSGRAMAEIAIMPNGQISHFLRQSLGY